MIWSPIPLLVPSTEMITTEYLEALAEADLDDTDPAKAAAELIAAVDEHRIARREDVGYALSMAAQLLHNVDDERALEVAEQALAADQALAVAKQEPVDDGPTRALRATLLVRAGRADEGMAEFSALRPRLVEDAVAAEYLIDALVAADLPQVAELWLDEATTSFVARLQELDAAGEEPSTETAATMYALLQSRRELREELERPVDDLDEFAEQMEQDLADETDFDLRRPAMIYWSKGEWERLTTLHKEPTGDWDSYRANLERGLQRLRDSGPAEILLAAGSVDDLLAFARERGAPIDNELLTRYGEMFQADGDVRVWPPGRNEACWCESGQKYKRCCLPRART